MSIQHVVHMCVVLCVHLCLCLYVRVSHHSIESLYHGCRFMCVPGLKDNIMGVEFPEFLAIMIYKEFGAMVFIPDSLTPEDYQVSVFLVKIMCHTEHFSYK